MKKSTSLGCLGKPRGSDLSAKGWSGQGLEPKGEAFLRPPGCANRGRTTWFPAPRSPSSLTCGPQPSAAPTGCRPLGTQERTQWAFPAATATPERTTGGPSSREALSSLGGPVLSGVARPLRGSLSSGGPCPWGSPVLSGGTLFSGGPCPWGGPVLSGRTLSSGEPCPLGGTLSSGGYPILSGGGDRVLSGGPYPSWGGLCPLCREGPCLLGSSAPHSMAPADVPGGRHPLPTTWAQCVQ